MAYQSEMSGRVQGVWARAAWFVVAMGLSVGIPGATIVAFFVWLARHGAASCGCGGC